MKNSLDRIVPDGYIPFQGVNAIIKSNQHKTIPKVLSTNSEKIVKNISELFDKLKIKDGMTLSFHHHLRNGDAVLNMVLKEIQTRNLKNMILAPSSIFPVHQPMVELIKNENVTKIYTNYLNGPVADAITHGYLQDVLIMDSHGGRPRAIESGELKIDVAFIATPTSDKHGNGNGVEGKSACGTLGYAIADLHFAKQKVVITDHLVNKVSQVDIDGKYVDYVLTVNQIGEASGIVSGTTKPTKDPVQIKIAKDTAQLLEELGYLKDNMTFQTGAGGTSLAVAEEVKKKMLKNKIKGNFASGGITSFLVNMYQIGLFKKLFDVQCFDLDAVESYKNNKNHIFMTASEYGNPYEKNPIVNQLDIVILGATEIDLDFNVNVTTDSHGNIIGGSGGHSDTAYGAKLTIITTNLVKSRTSIVKEKVTSITTPGESIDCLVTERGIAIHPKRTDLLAKLKYSKLKIVSIEALYNQAIRMTGVPNTLEFDKRIVGLIRYRDGSIIDSIYQLRGKSNEL
ncbi:MAG: citrate lyase subunit alpha [Tenericutes bacterium]|nr:citrate lyase subunit alpha [Mycoplasmatota bacterium]